MNGSFFGLDVALRGLYTAHRNLSVMNHNINNINTPGYSRQVAVQAALKPIALLDGTGMMGTGAGVISIDRIRDEYLDYKYWSEAVTRGEWKMKSELLTEMEVTFNEPSESGFTTIMNEFFNSLQDLAGDPGSLSNRSIVRQRGVTLAKYFNSTAAHFEKMQDDINQQVRIKVEEINSLAGQIQQLNRQIYMSELDGNTANDLRDKRTLLVDRMSEIINVNASEVVVGKLPDGRENKHFIITISGKAIVDHYEISELAVEQRNVKLNPEDIDGLYEVKWADGNTLNIKSGELRGLLDIRDGKSGIDGSPNYKGIPFYQMKMNEFVRAFAMAINEGYIDMDGDGIIQPGEDRAGHVDGYDWTLTADRALPDRDKIFTILGDDGLPVDGESFVTETTIRVSFRCTTK